MTATFETLKRRADFLRAARGRKWVTPTIILQSHTRPNGEEAPPRFGFTATRKLGGAVVRNRVKRRMREAVRRLSAGDVGAGRDYVLIGRGNAVQAPFRALVADLRSAVAAIAEPKKAPRNKRVGHAR